MSRTTFPAVLLLLLVLLAGCSTLKGLFTAQGQKLSQAQSWESQGNPHGASALAVEALLLEPGYREAQLVLQRTFGPGQVEFQRAEARWLAASEPERWDRLYQIYQWQETLALHGRDVGAPEPVSSVADRLASAARGASLYHWEKAQLLLSEAPGPRQARRALAEGRVAATYDETTPGLGSWLATTREAAQQKLMVFPFFAETTGKVGPVSSPLAQRISRLLLESDDWEMTSVFPSERLVTLPGAGLARVGLVTQPDALALAAVAGQNLVLMGQITRASYQPPQSVVRTVARERKALLVDPDHPSGVEKVYRAQVTTTSWSTATVLAATFSVTEVATERDLVVAVREAKVEDEAILTTFTGDREALSSEDLKALDRKQPLRSLEELWSLTLDSLASQVAEAVVDSLQ